MTKVAKDIEISKRLRDLVKIRYPARGRFRLLEQASGVPEWKWKNFFYGRQEAGEDQLNFWSSHFPDDSWHLTRKDDFARGFFCAVASLIKMHGLSTEANELFRLAGDPGEADPYDQEVFRAHGLMS